MWSTNEMLLRRYHAEVRQVMKWCEEHETELHKFDDADENQVCILSMSEYDIGSEKREISEDNESYFVNEEYYLLYYDEKIS